MSFMTQVMISSLFSRVVTLGLLGFAIGKLFARTANRKKGGASTQKQGKRPVDEATKRRLRQLKEQLDSGLLTKEEYREKRDALLKE